MYCVQASPLTKIFLPEWQARCLNDPSLILQKDKFCVRIPRPCGGIELFHGVPTLTSSLITATKERKLAPNEAEDLAKWLTESNDTDLYGVVEVQIESRMSDAIIELVHGGDLAKTQDLITKIQAKMGKDIVDARERADERVKKACGKMYSVIRATVEQMKKDGKGVYSPSYSEALAFDVLKDVIVRRQKPDEQAAKMMSSAMEAMKSPGV